ncbi:ataxin-10 [Micractinium conductrix]|uniref:Ataxin-10 n=1 Tax=Micractinium conductrix TaxID=554055 RepID=A0A2P6V0Y2_9CHLO|nr:ataxin-10 [Micractinium conductrix]|eukprot:PSC67748.1 ataxin-10 [Micractinium conductrix]
MQGLLASVSAAQHDEDSPEQLQRATELTLGFRALRNAAAAGGGGDAVVAAGVLPLAAAALDALANATITLDWQLPAAVAQALANLCNAGASAAAAAWAALFPLRFTLLAHVNTGPAQAATCLALLACCRTLGNAAAALAGLQGSQLMTALLCNHHRMLEQGEHNANLGLLAVHLCFSQDLLPQLWASLGGSNGGDGGSAGVPSTAQQPSMAQAALLELLGSEAHDVPQAEAGAADSQHNGGSGSDASPWNASPRFLVSLVRLLAAASAAQPGGLSPGQQQVLQEALRLVRDICARDDSGRGLTGGSGGADLVAALQAAGAVRTLLALLKALAPIQPWRRRQQPGAAAQAESAAAAAAAAGAAGPSAGAGSAGGIQVAELAPQLAAEAAGLPSAPPYPGYRSDLLAALANAAHARPAVQAEVGSLGGVELVLAQCQVDGESPLAREWALWGVRNLCEGNPAAQEAIRQLKLCTTVESEEAQRLGVKLDLDESTGKLRVTKREPPPGVVAAAGAQAAPVSS